MVSLSRFKSTQPPQEDSSLSAMASHDHQHHHHHHDHEPGHEKPNGSNAKTSWVGPDGRVFQSHDGLAPHSHKPIYSLGYFCHQAPPLNDRNFSERALRRYWWSCWHNGTRKTALMLALCRFLRFKYSLAVTNDIFTKEDGDFLVKNGALAEERIKAIETGGCSYVAIREDISINLGPLEELSNLFKDDLLLCESDGG